MLRIIQLAKLGVLVGMSFISLYIRDIDWSVTFGVATSTVHDRDAPLHAVLVRCFARYDTDRRFAIIGIMLCTCGTCTALDSKCVYSGNLNSTGELRQITIALLNSLDIQVSASEIAEACTREQLNDANVMSM